MRCGLVVVRMNVYGMEVVVVECCGASDCVVTGGSVEMNVVRLPWLVMLYVWMYGSQRSVE